jgi:hypothetical protein
MSQSVLERLDRAIQEVLQGGHDPSLTDYEQKLYLDMVAELRQTEEADRDLYRLDYSKRPPSIEEFILDEYYLGRSWKHIEGENEGMWPAWLEMLKKNLDGKNLHPGHHSPLPHLYRLPPEEPPALFRPEPGIEDCIQLLVGDQGGGQGYRLWQRHDLHGGQPLFSGGLRL